MAEKRGKNARPGWGRTKLTGYNEIECGAFRNNHHEYGIDDGTHTGTGGTHDYNRSS